MADRHGHQKEIEELKDEWLGQLLSFMGIDIHSIHEIESSHFRDYLINQNIEIIEYLDVGALCVLYQSEPVGEWASPVLTLKRDDKGVLYYEVKVECWSIIEENLEIQ